MKNIAINILKNLYGINLLFVGKAAFVQAVRAVAFYRDDGIKMTAAVPVRPFGTDLRFHVFLVVFSNV